MQPQGQCDGFEGTVIGDGTIVVKAPSFTQRQNLAR
jgi:hypothetical protein